MSDKVFYALSGLVAVGLIALALVWPPRAATGLDEGRAAPVTPPSAAAEAPPAPAAEPVDDAAAAAEPAGE